MDKLTYAYINWKHVIRVSEEKGYLSPVKSHTIYKFIDFF